MSAILMAGIIKYQLHIREGRRGAGGNAGGREGRGIVGGGLGTALAVARNNVVAAD